MKRRRVIIAPVAQDQIDAQVLHIAMDSIRNALAWEGRLRKAIADIGAMPGNAIDEDATDRLGYEVRKSVFENTYLIHYYVDDKADIVRIIGFRHGARLPREDEP